MIKTKSYYFVLDVLTKSIADACVRVSVLVSQIWTMWLLKITVCQYVADLGLVHSVVVT